MKVKGPLLSVTAQGSIDKALTYSRRQGVNVLRQYTKPTGVVSASQTTQRAVFKAIITEWNALSAAERIGWLAIDYLLLPLSGYNIFLGRTSLKRKVHLFGNKLFGQAVFGSPGL